MGQGKSFVHWRFQGGLSQVKRNVEFLPISLHNGRCQQNFFHRCLKIVEARNALDAIDLLVDGGPRLSVLESYARVGAC